jgi:hypothetical protein
MSRAFTSRDSVGDTAIVTFHLDRDFIIPPNIVNANIKQFQNVLMFASKLIDMEISLTDEYTRTNIFAEYLKDIEQKHSQELLLTERQSINTMASKIEPLISKISQLENSHMSIIDQVKSVHEEELKSLEKSKRTIESESAIFKSEIQLAHQKDISALRNKIADQEAELRIASQSEALIRERCKQEYERLIAALNLKNDEIFAIKQEGLHQREQKLASKEQDLLAKEQEVLLKFQRKASSVLKGHDGEEFFKNITKEKMNWDLTKQPTLSCDYASTIQGATVLFEVKNYENQVPKAEITKFHRDMKLHSEATVGVFVSLQTGMSGFDPTIPISIDWIHDSQCVIYIQTCTELDIMLVLTSIDQIIRMVGVFNGLLASEDSKSEEKTFQSRIERAKEFLDRAIKRNSKLAKKIIADKKQQIELIEANTVHNISELGYITNELTTTINTMLGTYAEPESSDELTIALETPSSKTKKVPAKKEVKKQAKN